ncbi:MAG: hypothetical protein ACE5HD_05345 [Acidobacteriota bacterium]
MEGKRFKPHNLAEILRDQFRREIDGSLVLRGDAGEEVRIYFSRGLIEMSLRSGPHLEFLRGLRSLTGLSHDIPETMKTEPPGPDGLREFLGTAASRPEVQEAIQRETCVSVQEAFRISGGIWSLEEAASAHSFEPDMLSTVETFLSGIAAVERWAPVHRILAAQQRYLRPATVPIFTVERLPLAPEEGYLLSVMDGHVTFQQVCDLLPGGDRNRITRFVYSALILNLVEFEPALVEPFCLAAYEEQNRETRARREREVQLIDRFYQKLRSGSPYAILGVTDSASGEEVRQGYRERKEGFRPDCFLPEVRDERREELRIIETSLLEIYLQLHSLRMDAAEEKKREQSEKRTATVEQMTIKRKESVKTSRQEDQEDRERRAEEYYLKAREYFREGDFHNTVEFCQLAQRLWEQDPECHALLGRALAKNPSRRWQLRAERALKRAIELDSWNPHFYLHLAEFYQGQGLEQRASRLLEKAYQIAPSLRGSASPSGPGR